MFITDLKKNFYQKIVHKHVLLLASFDVDAVCTCKILQALFRCDQVRYTLVPVGGVADLESAFVQQCGDQIDVAVFINCGAAIDLWDLLKPPDHLTLFVIDSNRPVHLENLYDAETGNNARVMVLVHDDEDRATVPRFEEYYMDEGMLSEDEDGEDDADDEADEFSDDGSPSTANRRRKRRRLTENDLYERAERKKRRQEFEADRKNVLFDYYMRSSYARPSSILVYELAHVMTRGNNELLWWSIIGYTDYLLQAKMSKEYYISLLTDLHKQVTTFNRSIITDDEDGATSKDQIKIAFLDNEIMLSVYRRWTLYDSLEHSLLPACQFQVWNHAVTKLKGFLVDLGIPLNESNQTFTNMDLHYQQNMRSWISDKCDKYKLDDCVYASFEAKYGYMRTYGAADVASAVMALLEIGEPPAENPNLEHRFLLALDCLSRRNYPSIERGINTYKLLMKSVLEKVKSLINLSQVIPMGQFLQAHMNEAPAIFQTPCTLRWLARFLLHAYATEIYRRKRKDAKSMSLVLSMVRPEPNADWCFCIGIPPIKEEKDNPCSIFGAVYQEIQSGMEAFVRRPFFDPSIIEIRKDIRMRFFDKLKSRLSAS